MKKVIIFLIALLPAMTGWAQQDYRKKVAVVPATGNDVTQSVRDGVTDGLTTAIVRSGQYRVLTRDDFDKVLAEIKFQQTGFVDDKQLTELGHALGADYVCFASIREFIPGKEYSITYKLIDVATGQILDADQESVYDGSILRGTERIVKKLFGDNRD
jgi:TolB-like protein